MIWYKNQKSCFASSDLYRGCDDRSVVFREFFAVESILERSRSNADCLTESWERARAFGYDFALLLITLVLLRWVFMSWLSFSACSLFCILPFLVEGLSLVRPKTVNEIVFSNFLSKFSVSFSSPWTFLLI